MKAMITALVFGGLVGFAANATTVEATGCVLKDMQVKSVSLFVVNKGSGTATLVCDGNGPGIAMSKMVSIDIAGVALGLGTFEFYGAEVSLGIHNPYDLEGKYAVVGADAAFGLGVGGSLGLRAYEEGGLSFRVGIRGGEGVGLGLNASTWTFTVLD